jgi:endonuclease/exonuclease/phosphatase family metal-dependent hydrolase
VLLQEATRPASVARIAEAAHLPHHAARRGNSLAVLSRIPIQSHAWRRPRASQHAFLEVILEGETAPVFGVHLSAVHSAWTERRRVFELRGLLAAIRQHQSGFHILSGDFNTLAPGETLDFRLLPQRLRALVWLSGGRIRWRTIQRMLDAGYADVFRARHPADAGLTFPTWSPHVRLDYAFVPAGFTSRVTSCDVVTAGPTKEASDHFPLLTEVR